MTTLTVEARPRPQERAVRVQLLDHDPISRHVIERYLREAAGLHVVASSADHGEPRIGRLLAVTDVAVLCGGTESCCATPDRLADTVAAMRAHGVRVLLLASRWTRQLVESAVSVGVHGCLVKTHRLDGLAAGIHAVDEGQCVLSPELLALCLGGTPPAPADLTPREREVLALLSRGLSTQEAAVSLRISPATVKSHVSHALTKLGARNRLEAVLRVRAAVEA